LKSLRGDTSMKRPLVLGFLLLLAAGMAAQQLATPTSTEVASVSTTPQFTYRAWWLAPDHNAGTPQAQPQTSQRGRRPKSEGSMVGYIYDAVIASQIRVRFDAAWNDEFPDQAEFFYAKRGCYRGLATALPAAFDPAAPGPGPGVPDSVNFQQLAFMGEFAPSKRFSLFFELPVRWLQPQFQLTPPFANQSGISDVRLGAKLGLIASENQSLTFQFQSFLPSGDPAKGMGTNHASIEPSLLYRGQVTPRFSIEGQIGGLHPLDSSRGVPTNSSQGFAGDILLWGIGPAYQVYRGDRVKVVPVVEFVGWHIFSGFKTSLGGPILGAATDVSGTNIVNAKFGVRTFFGDHSSIYAGFGHALTDADWYHNILRVEYRYTF